MKKVFVISVLLICTASVALGSELINDRIQFYSFIGYINEKFIVPDGKSCMVRLETNAMSQDGIYTIAIAKIPETEPVGNPEIIYQATKEYSGNSGLIQIEMDQIPVTPGGGLMLTTMYMTDTLDTFSVPVQSGGIEIGHNDVYSLSSLPPPISEPGYTVFTLYYGCGETGECVNTAPQFTSGSNISAKAGHSYEIQNWATNIRPGASDCESEQNLTFDVIPNIASAFTQSPTIDPMTGTLRFEASPDIQEEITVKRC